MGDSEYFVRVAGHIKKADFSAIEEQALLTGIEYLFQNYKKAPNIDEVKLFFETTASINIKLKKAVLEKIELIENQKVKSIDMDILIDSTEKYIRNVRTESLLERGIKILEGDSKETIEDIHEAMKAVVQLSFRSSMGHDYFKDSMIRFLEYGKMDENLVSSGIELINKAGGGKPKTITIFLAESNAGKSLWLSSWAVHASINGFNVAVFSMEDGEMGWSSRLDANFMNTNLEYMKSAGVALQTTFQSVISDSFGRIKLKEYPTGGANVNHFKAVLQEWRIKDNFIPDIIFADYIGIMIPNSSTASGYEKGKAVTEDLRGLAVEMNVAVVSAVQARRDVYNSNTLNMSDTADSIGIPQGADCMIGIISGGEDHPDKQFISVLKSRQINKSTLKPTAVYVSTDQQRVWDIDDKRAARLTSDAKAIVSEMNQFVENAEMLSNTCKKGNDDLKDIFPI
jgi:replicative DNA helicase